MEWTTETETDQRLVTYVSPEEFERMTEAERARLNAAMGAEASMVLWGGKPAKSKDVDHSELHPATRPKD